MLGDGWKTFVGMVIISQVILVVIAFTSSIVSGNVINVVTIAISRLVNSIPQRKQRRATTLFLIALAQHRMVVVRRRGPPVRHEASRSDIVHQQQHEHLHEHPGGKTRECARRRRNAQKVIRVEVEVCKGGEAQGGLAPDVVPAESLATVALHVAVDLRQPEGEADEREAVDVGSAEKGGPGG